MRLPAGTGRTNLNDSVPTTGMSPERGVTRAAIGLLQLLIGNTGDVARFPNRDRFAAYNGTAPTEFSSGGRVAHRVSQRGNRTLNHALHLAAVSRLRPCGSAGRDYYERRLAEGKTARKPSAPSSDNSATSSTGTSPPTRSS